MAPAPGLQHRPKGSDGEGVWLGPGVSALYACGLSWGVGWDTQAQDGTTDSVGHTAGGGLRRDDVVPAKTLGEGSRVGHSPLPRVSAPQFWGRGEENKIQKSTA